MARFASFSTPDAGMPGGGQTLAALMARQKQLADQQTAQASSAYPGQGTVVGGLGHMAQMFFTGLAQRKAQQQEAEGRQALAQAISGIDPSTGIASPDQLATVMGLDPDLGARLYAEAAAARRADREYQRTRADQLADRETGYAHEADVNARELAESQAARKEQEAFTVSQTQAATQAEIDKERRQAAQPQTDVGRLKAELDAGNIDQATYDAAVKKATTVPNTATASDRKALWDTQDAYIESQSAIGNLKEASDLLKQGINWGYTEGAQTMAGAMGIAGDKEQAQRTKRYNQIMNAQAIAAMSQQLKGATSNQEMTEFIKNMNDPTIDPKVKGQMVDTMLAKAQTYQELQRGRIKDMGGEPPELQKPAAAADEATLLKDAQSAIDRGADRQLVIKRLIEKGVDPAKLPGG